MTTASSGFPGERRVHFGLAVSNVDRSKRFYRTLFGVEPVKERPGYAKFEPADPSVNLSLIETSGAPARAHSAAHFGIQVKTTRAVAEATERLAAAGLDTLVEERTVCCFAVQDKVWVTDPDGNRWEVFVVLDDAGAPIAADSASGSAPGPAPAAACCEGAACCATDTDAALAAADEAAPSAGACCS